jgi:hypothetical protein
MLRIWIAVLVAAVIAAIAALATEPVRAVDTRGPQPAVKGDRLQAPQRNDCSSYEGSISPRRCLPARLSPMQGRSEVRTASNRLWRTIRLGA